MWNKGDADSPIYPVNSAIAMTGYGTVKATSHWRHPAVDEQVWLQPEDEQRAHSARCEHT